jgi:hypothetical protein
VDDQFLNNLANARYITYPVSFSFGKRGRSMQYVEMLPAGAKFIEKDLIDVTLPPGKNKTLQSKIAVYNIFLNRKKDGSKVALEWRGSDIAEWTGKSWKSLFLYEYETAVQPHIIKNVTRGIENGCTMVYVVMDTKAQRDEAEALLKMSLSEKDFKKVGFKATQKFL